MNLEAILETISKLADAINNHADAMRHPAGYQAVKQDVSSVGKAETAPAADSKPEPKDDPNREVYWKHETSGQYGKCSIGEYRKMHKQDDEHSLIDPDEYKALCEAAKKREKANQAAAEKARKAKEAEEAKRKAEEDEAASEVQGAPKSEISDDDLGALVRPFATVDTPAERERRVAWLKTLFSRFGVKKATELPQETRAEFVAIVEKAVEAVTDDEGAELPDIEGDMSDLV